MEVALFQVANQIKAILSDTTNLHAEPDALRLAFSFVETFERTEPATRRNLVEDPPESVGDSRFDALLAALTEHACVVHNIESPAWVEGPERFLDRWWFVAGLRSLEADALVHSPISFARRGVFITGDALTYA